MYVNVDSQFRQNGTYSNFTINMSSMPPKICRIKLLDVKVPMTMNTFDGVKSIRFVEAATSGTTRNALITGNYNETTILTAIQTAMNGAGTQTYTATYTPSLNSITISVAANFSLKFSGSDTAYRRLGFAKVDTPQATSASGSSIDLSPTGTYFLTIHGLGLPFVTTGGSSFGNFPIFLDAPSYAYGVWQNDIYEPIPANISNNSLNVQLSNNDGTPVTLTQDWSFNFLIIPLPPKSER
jgi:hypothetical protein